MIKVTILMAIYKPNMKWLEEQLKSLDAQTYNNLELLVWNDAPDDMTDYEPVFKRYIKKFRYKIYKGENNLGSNGAFEELTKLADSEYIAYCDQDDVWLPEKLRVLVEEAIKSKADLLCSDMYVIDKDSNVVADSITQVRPRHIFFEGNNVFEYLLAKNFVTGCTTLVRTQMARNSLPFPKEFVHDWWLGLYISAYGKIKIIKKSLIKYRIHGGNQTGVLSGINCKEDYYHKRVSKEIIRSLVLKKRFSENKYEKLLKEFDCFVALRVDYFNNFTLSKFIRLFRLRKFNKSTTYFELFLPFIPEFIFGILIKQIRQGNI